jgi:two-component system alkaline phosphatase synthesis response regulator PhoP
MLSKKIVIIEDDAILLRALRFDLESVGYQVFSVSDGLSGINLVTKELPDLILLDLILPIMHGFEVLDRFKKNKKTKDIPVIILTNLGQDSDREKGLKLGAVDYFVKSTIGLGSLTSKINKLLKKDTARI